jgi:sarcosine/dimethylglycine N-methyltransferase
MSGLGIRDNLQRPMSLMLASQDDTEAAKAWIGQLRASGPPSSPNLGVVMGPDFAQLAANLGRNLMEGRLGILTAVFETAPINT